MVVVEQMRKLMYYLWEGRRKGGREGRREGGREGGREGSWEVDGRKVQEMEGGRKKRKGNWRLREVERIIKIFCII